MIKIIIKEVTEKGSQVNCSKEMDEIPTKVRVRRRFYYLSLTTCIFCLLIISSRRMLTWLF